MLSPSPPQTFVVRGLLYQTLTRDRYVGDVGICCWCDTRLLVVQRNANASNVSSGEVFDDDVSPREVFEEGAEGREVFEEGGDSGKGFEEGAETREAVEKEQVETLEMEWEGTCIMLPDDMAFDDTLPQRIARRPLGVVATDIHGKPSFFLGTPEQCTAAGYKERQTGSSTKMVCKNDLDTSRFFEPGSSLPNSDAVCGPKRYDGCVCHLDVSTMAALAVPSVELDTRLRRIHQLIDRVETVARAINHAACLLGMHPSTTHTEMHRLTFGYLFMHNFEYGTYRFINPKHWGCLALSVRLISWLRRRALSYVSCVELFAEALRHHCDVAWHLFPWDAFAEVYGDSDVVSLSQSPSSTYDALFGASW